jgi:hypothetical protein
MKIYRIGFLYFFAIVFMVSFLACAGSPDKSQSGEQASAESKTIPGVEKIELSTIDSIPMRTPLGGKFDNIIFRSFESTDQFKKDYPYACENCKAAIIEQLQSKKAYKNVTDDVSQNLPGKSVFVDMKVVDMRIAGGQARFWGGALAGNSYMDVLLELREADSQAVVHKKVLSTTNNAFAAAWSFGSSDRSMPSDLGTLMGEYIFRIVPSTQWNH